VSIQRSGHALAVLMAAPVAGCTLIRLGIGAEVDKKAQPKPVATYSLATASKGSDLELTLRDGSVVSGRFDGLEPVPEAQYRERWKESLQALATITPVPGLGRVQVRTKAGQEADATLVGITPAQVRLLESPASGPASVPFDKLASLGVPGGGAVDGATLARLAQEGSSPIEDVRTAAVRSSHGGKLIGGLVGAAVDAIVVGTVVNSLNNMDF
jgi:hypothetical protein